MTEPLSDEELADIEAVAEREDTWRLLDTIAADRTRIAALEAALRGRDAVMVAAYLVASSPLYTSSVDALRAALNAYDAVSDIGIGQPRSSGPPYNAQGIPM